MKPRMLLILGPLLCAAPVAAQEQPQEQALPPAHAEHGRRFERGPVEVLLRHRDQLGLTDAQVARLQALDARMEERNRPLVERLLEMRRAHRGERRDRERPLTEEERREMRRRKEQARPLMREIRQNNREAMSQVGEILTEEQKTRLREIIRERREQWRDEHRRDGKHGRHGDHHRGRPN